MAFCSLYSVLSVVSLFPCALSCALYCAVYTRSAPISTVYAERNVHFRECLTNLKGKCFEKSNRGLDYMLVREEQKNKDRKKLLISFIRYIFVNIINSLGTVSEPMAGYW